MYFIDAMTWLPAFTYAYILHTFIHSYDDDMNKIIFFAEKEKRRKKNNVNSIFKLWKEKSAKVPGKKWPCMRDAREPKKR